MSISNGKQFDLFLILKEMILIYLLSAAYLALQGIQVQLDQGMVGEMEFLKRNSGLRTPDPNCNL